MCIDLTENGKSKDNSVKPKKKLVFYNISNFLEN